MNRVAIRSDLQALGFGSDSATAQNAAINRVYRRVLGLRRWDFLEAQTTATVASGASTVTLPSDFKRLDRIDIKDAAGDPLYMEFKPYNEFRDQAHAFPETGTPQWWTERGGVVSIWPTADATYTLTLDYIKHAPDLTDDSHIPLLPVEYHDVLVYGAAAELAARERDWTMHSVMANSHTTRLGEMVAEHGVRQRQNDRTVRRSGFWDSIRSYG